MSCVWGLAEERGRGGGRAHGEGDRRRRGRLPRLRRGAAQEPHRHGRQGMMFVCILRIPSSFPALLGRKSCAEPRIELVHCFIQLVVAHCFFLFCFVLFLFVF